MQKEMQGLGDEGYDYKGQTIFSSTFGGREVSVIMERRDGLFKGRLTYKLQATSRTSTMQKELNQAGQDGFELVGLTVANTAFGGSQSCRSCAVGLTAAALPVTLVDFRALRLNAAAVQLNWETATEQNNKGFDVERRWQNETIFKTIGFVASLAPGGTSNQLLHYNYADPNNYKGISYYRLKQIDIDNRSTYTLIKAVKGMGDASVTVLLWPNPNKGQFSIRMDGNTKRLPAYITDMNGRVVQQVSIYENTPVNINGLSAGTYIINIPDAFGQGEAFREKVMVVR